MRGDKASDRSDPAFWVQEMNACIKRNKVQMDRFVRFARWYRGDLSDIVDPDATPTLENRWEINLDNMHLFVTDAAIASLFFRNPRFAIRSPSGRAGGIWTPALARIEAMMLNDTIEQIGYFRQARRRLLDARLGPFGVLKITYDCDMVVDHETIENARTEAQLENQAFVTASTAGEALSAMVATESQIHSAHIDVHQELLAMAQRGEVPLPKPAIKYLRKHIKKHESMRSSETPTEFARDASIVCRRVNPLHFFYDTSVDDIWDARWYCHSYFIRMADAKGNSRFSRKARDECAAASDRWQRNGVTMHQYVPTPGTFDSHDELVLVNEVYDRVDGTIREFFEGGSEMACEREFTLRSVQPNGPYSILMFKPDPLEAAGLPPPIAWEAEQSATTALQSASVAAAIAGSRAGTVYNGAFVDPADMERIENRKMGDNLRLNLPGGNDADIRKAFAPAPTVELKEQTLVMRSDVRSRISQSSGLGSQKTLSGDRSGSATEAAITSGAADAISEDQAAILDDASAYDGKMIVRLTRKCVPKAKVVEVCGDEAIEVYPDQWADRDIVNDRNVYPIPGSSRRRQTSIDSKLTMDGIVAASSVPAMAGPSGQSAILEMLRRWFEDQGLSGIDWESVDAEQKAQAMMQQMMMGGAPGAPGATGAPPEGGGEPPSESPQDAARRPSEMSEPSVAGQAQGAANAGGGRIPTGAGQGDNYRFVRGKV